jgi:hypothetical protein
MHSARNLPVVGNLAISYEVRKRIRTTNTLRMETQVQKQATNKNLLMKKIHVSGAGQVTRGRKISEDQTTQHLIKIRQGIQKLAHSSNAKGTGVNEGGEGEVAKPISATKRMKNRLAATGKQLSLKNVLRRGMSGVNRSDAPPTR